MINGNVGPNFDQDILAHIRPRMVVWDCMGEEVGMVVGVYMGETNKDQRAAYPAEVTASSRTLPASTSFTKMVMPVLAADNLPYEVIKEWRQSGFLQVACTGSATQHCYITPNQISHVLEQRVYLHLAAPQLIKW
jgi:hypothetical protein